ncbi:MAG: hypothetical protein QOJ64_4283 [Acidobacteriota bacterium]|nr:hypothetical protein [Acidobacteriota bacterium]
MRFGITKAVLSCEDFIDISREQYESTRDAQQKLAKVLNIEEKFNFVVENYVEYEQELLKSSLDSMMFAVPEWSDRIAEVHKVNRRLINLLTTCRLYVESRRHDIASLLGRDNGQIESLERQIADERDSNPAYRFIEALRNYAQHRSFPVHVLGHTMRTLETNSGTFVTHTIAPRIDVAELRTDRNFDQNMLRDLENPGHYIEIKPVLCRYIEWLGRIHTSIRGLLDERVTEWDSVIRTIQNSYKPISDDLTGLAIVTVDDSESIGETIYVFDDYIKRRRNLVQKNRIVMNLSKHVITSEVETNDP